MKRGHRRIDDRQTATTRFPDSEASDDKKPSAILILPAMAGPLLAHHSEAADDDLNKKVNITGTITKVEWQNPHIRFASTRKTVPAT